MRVSWKRPRKRLQLRSSGARTPMQRAFHQSYRNLSIGPEPDSTTTLQTIT